MGQASAHAFKEVIDPHAFDHFAAVISVARFVKLGLVVLFAYPASLSLPPCWPVFRPLIDLLDFCRLHKAYRAQIHPPEAY